MPTAIPPDDSKRNLTLAQPDTLPHIGLVGDTYTITVTGGETDGRFCVIDMYIPPGGGPTIGLSTNLGIESIRRDSLTFMATDHILALLVIERDKLNGAIEALQGPTTT